MVGRTSSPLSLPLALPVLIRAAEAAGAAALKFYTPGGTTTAKIRYKLHNSPVTEGDLAADAAIRAVMAAELPEVRIQSEEDAGPPARIGPEPTLVMDPIDGTRAFMTGRNEWCVSLALFIGQSPVAGVIHAPARRELYSAARGHGAKLNGAPLTRRSAPTGRPMRLTGPNRLVDTLTDHWPASTDGETLRALAYRLVSVAAGAHDVAVATLGANHWDIAAADVLLRETGCVLRPLTGGWPVYNGPDPVHPALLAAEAGLAERLVAALGKTPA